MVIDLERRWMVNWSFWRSRQPNWRTVSIGRVMAKLLLPTLVSFLMFLFDFFLGWAYYLLRNLLRNMLRNYGDYFVAEPLLSVNEVFFTMMTNLCFNNTFLAIFGQFPNSVS
jgi:hypothetical protein